MKGFFKKVGYAILTVLGGFVLGIIAVLSFKKRDSFTIEEVNDDAIEKRAEEVRQNTKDFILRSPSHRIAGQYECTRDAIERGTKRLRERAKELLHRRRGE